MFRIFLYRLPALSGMLAMLLLGACATSPQGRPQLTAPAAVGDAYSEVDLRLRLAFPSDSTLHCMDSQCTSNRQFDARVQLLGERLAAAAFDLYPDLGKRVTQFRFSVAEKATPGSTSTGSGKIVIYRGVQYLGLAEETLALVIAREMGHVIGRHHDENSATRLLFSVLAGVLFPATNLFNGSTAAAQATSVTSASTLTTTAASTATSLVGSELVLANIKPGQLNEADTIALTLVEALGWSRQEIIAPLRAGLALPERDAWSDDLRGSIARFVALDTTEHGPTLPESLGEVEEAQPIETADTDVTWAGEEPVQLAATDATPPAPSPPEAESMTPLAPGETAIQPAPDVTPLAPVVRDTSGSQTPMVDSSSGKHDGAATAAPLLRLSKEKTLRPGLRLASVPKKSRKIVMAKSGPIAPSRTIKIAKAAGASADRPVRGTPRSVTQASGKSPAFLSRVTPASPLPKPKPLSSPIAAASKPPVHAKQLARSVLQRERNVVD